MELNSTLNSSFDGFGYTVRLLRLNSLIDVVIQLTVKKTVSDSQLFISVIITQYSPLTSGVIVCVVSFVDQLYERGVTPPLITSAVILFPAWLIIASILSSTVKSVMIILSHPLLAM